MLSTIPSRRHSSAIAYSPRRPDNTIRIFSSAEYRLRVARRISRTCCSAVSDGTDFCLIFAPSRATMSQKSSLRKIPQSVSQLLTGNTYDILTPYGRKRIQRNKGEFLHPALVSLATLETQRRAMTEYNFTAQYQQNPQPPSGIIVKREWLRFYGPNEKPERFDQIVESWDTANKDSELANFSVCTTWGVKGQHLYLLDVYRRKVDFPDLKRAVRELAARHHSDVVLVEDKASGISLIQELRAEGFSLVQEAPAIDGDKIMRLHAQTAKIEGGFVLLPKEAHWLDAYVLELTTFPNSKHDDQVDSTVFALAWSTLNMSK